MKILKTITNPFWVITFFSVIHFLSMWGLFLCRPCVTHIYYLSQTLNAENFLLSLERFVRIKSYLIAQNDFDRWPLIIDAYVVSIVLLTLCIVAISIVFPFFIIRLRSENQMWRTSIPLKVIWCFPLTISLFILVAALALYDHVYGVNDLSAVYKSMSSIHRSNADLFKLTVDFTVFLVATLLGGVMLPLRLLVELKRKRLRVSAA